MLQGYVYGGLPGGESTLQFTRLTGLIKSGQGSGSKLRFWRIAVANPRVNPREQGKNLVERILAVDLRQKW